jgi:hypothetical protein
MIDIRAVVIILAIYIVWIVYTRRTCPNEAFEDVTKATCDDARKQYLVDYPDVARHKADPWSHYQKHGKKEGRKWKGEPCKSSSEPKKAGNSGAQSSSVPSPIPLEDLQQNFLQARQVEGSALDTKMSQRKGAAYLDLRPDVPVVMDRTAWMNLSSIDDSERISNIERQRQAWGQFFNTA